VAPARRLPIHRARRKRWPAHITLSIDHGASGTAISVSGTAWPANAQITIDFVDTGDQNLGRPGIAQAQTDGAGAFHSSEFLAPEAICGVSPGAGTVSLVVAHTADGSVKAQARFTFVTSPKLTTTDLHSDSLSVQSANVQVTGHSWGAGILVTLYATKGQIVDHAISFSRIPNTPSVQVRADATGAFQTSVPLPSGLLPAIYVSVATTATSPLYGSLTRDLSTMLLITPEFYPSVALSLYSSRLLALRANALFKKHQGLLRQGQRAYKRRFTAVVPGPFSVGAHDMGEKHHRFGEAQRTRPRHMPILSMP
jgi:hypothetical protein